VGLRCVCVKGVGGDVCVGLGGGGRPFVKVSVGKGGGRGEGGFEWGHLDVGVFE
jgi:hypothetical protein